MEPVGDTIFNCCYHSNLCFHFVSIFYFLDRYVMDNIIIIIANIIIFFRYKIVIVII